MCGRLIYFSIIYWEYLDQEGELVGIRVISEEIVEIVRAVHHEWSCNMGGYSALYLNEKDG